MYTLTRKLAVVCLTLVLSVLVYGCGGSSKQALITDVSTNMVTTGLTADSGTNTIQPSGTWTAGDVIFECPAEGAPCEVTVAEDGTAMSAGGMATAMDSDSATARLAAEQGQADAEQAQADAEQAQADAEQAQADAEQAQADAEGNTADAEQAQADAETAQADAETAQADAEQAQADAEQAQADAEQAQADAEGDTADAEQAQADAETAQADAETAQADAETAQADAETAQADAETAQADAEGDTADAEQAQADAETAQADAETAQADAETAQADAETAQADAETAQADAETAQADAETAQADAETAQADAETAQADAETAQADAETAQADAETAQADAETAQADAETAQADAETAQADAEQALEILIEANRLAAQTEADRLAALRVALNTVDMSMVTTGLKITAGNYLIEAGGRMDAGDATLTCPAGEVPCAVTVAEDGTAMSVGGAAMAMNSAVGYAKLNVVNIVSLTTGTGDDVAQILAMSYDTITPGTYTIQPGSNRDVGDANFACPEGGVPCVLTVTVDEAALTTVTSLGGAATVRNSMTVTNTREAVALGGFGIANNAGALGVAVDADGVPTIAASMEAGSYGWWCDKKHGRQSYYDYADTPERPATGNKYTSEAVGSNYGWSGQTLKRDDRDPTDAESMPTRRMKQLSTRILTQPRRRSLSMQQDQCRHPAPH